VPKKQRSLLQIKQLIAVILGIGGFISLLGELGISNIGREMYSLLKYLLGQAAWVGPFLLFILAFILWTLSSNKINQSTGKIGKGNSKERSLHKRKMKSENPERLRNSKKIQNNRDNLVSFNGFDSGIPLPKAKLVNLKGFDEYFSSPEVLEIASAVSMEGFEDLGHNFSTYFKEGSDISFSNLGTRLTPVRGFSSYFDEVSSEIENEIKKYARPDAGTLFPLKREWGNNNQADDKTVKSYPGQVAQLLNYENKSSSGVSPEERATLLGGLSHPSYDVLEDKIKTSTESIYKVDNLVESNFIGSLDIESYESESEQHLELPTQDNVDTEIEIKKENNNEIVGVTNELNNCWKASKTTVNTEEPLYNRLTETKISQVNEINSVEMISEGSRPNVWKLPQFDLLDNPPQIPLAYDSETQKQLERVLEDFGVQAKVVRVARGPVITRYELAPAPGVKISRIVNLADDIALGLAARDVRIEAPIPGKAAIGIEVPNKQSRSVPFREVLETPEFKEGSSKLRIALGKDIANQSVVADLAKMPHLLVAGATGSGKSVCITALINSLLFNARPSEVKFLMVDPKMVELSIYNGIPHLLAPVVTDPKKAAAALKWVVKEMETRYELFAAAGVRDIERYNRLKSQEQGSSMEQGEVNPALPWIIVIIDELADLMMVAADEVEEAICRLAQMARAAGIHLVIATQRPSVDVITGVIKANIPSRISFAVSSQIDSRTILDATGAEKLLGRGDMLYSPQGLNKPLRVQGCMVKDEEVQRVISFWKAQGRPEYLDPEGFTMTTGSERTESSGPDDELFAEAAHLIITTGMASVSFLQRKLKLGYARAARLMDLLEENGVVGGYEGSKPRQILLSIEEFEDRFG
jgi:DNA segregation ATPase FtsK/SpoIIIE, S-DNA-T family